MWLHAGHDMKGERTMQNDKQEYGKPITVNVIIKRINRALARQGRSGQVLKKTRGYGMKLDVGDYWIRDGFLNAVIDKFVDVEDLGRSLGVLRPGETLVADEDRQVHAE
jgi:hypothetical protein